MPTMVLRFPGGRYHATPGGHHVNEGVVEWPPSPWRIVRALVACGFTTQRWEEVPPAGRRLVEALSGVLPEYRLPRAALGHSRHYMPLAALDGDREKTTLVFDTFADVGEGVVWVRWPVALDDEAARLFETLTTHLGYLGRSESWVLAASAPDDAELPRAGRAFPHEEGAAPGRHFEQVLLSAPEPAEGYASWRRGELDAQLAALALPSGKKPTKAQQKKIDAVENAYPADLLDCLQRDTAWWKAQRWGRPPGMHSVTYWRESDALEVGPPAAPRTPEGPPVEMMLLALATPSGSRSALPTLERTLPQAHLLHQAIVSQLGYGGPPCPELVGRDEAGELLEGHRHAHLLPLDLDGDGRIEHLLVYAPMGLGARAQEALRRLRKTYMKGGVGELQMAVAGAGELADLRALGGGLEGGIEALLGPPGGARAWMTASPFVPPRHLKRRGRATLEGQVAEELRSRGLPAAEVELLAWAAPARRRRLRAAPALRGARRRPAHARLRQPLRPRPAPRAPRGIGATARTRSIRTMYRVLAEAGEVRERRNVRAAQPHPALSLTATAPNQVWTWDVTKLATTEKGVFLHPRFRVSNSTHRANQAGNVRVRATARRDALHPWGATRRATDRTDRPADLRAV